MNVCAHAEKWNENVEGSNVCKFNWFPYSTIIFDSNSWIMSQSMANEVFHNSN